MSQPTDKKNAPETAINNAPHAPLAVQPSGGIENQYPNPTTNKPEISEYKSDWLESLSRYEKGLILFVVIAGIYWIAFYSKWINEHQTEFFVGCLLSLSLLIVATCQT